MSVWLPVLAGACGALVALACLWPLRREARSSRRHHGLWVMSGSCGVIAAMLYMLLGTPQALDQAHDPQLDDLRGGVAELQQALREHPERGDGWALLGRSQLELGQVLPAARSFERAVQLLPDDAGVLVEAAQARAQADPGRVFDDQALAWLQHAQAVDPAAERATWLIGVALRQRGRDAEAAALWESLLPRLQPTAAEALRQQIAVARGETPAVPAAPRGVSAPADGNEDGDVHGSASGNTARDTDGDAADAGPHALTVRVSVAPGWNAATALPADATVFVIAREAGGSPMPVAVRRIALRDLPATVTLGDGDGPMPTQRLSQLQRVDVLARVSVSGQPGGDVSAPTSAVVPVALPHAAPVTLQIGPH